MGNLFVLNLLNELIRAKNNISSPDSGITHAGGDFDKKIKKFGELFKNRLDNDLLQDAIYYVDCNERGLAFETICDHISEYEVPITKKEYDIAISICNELKMDTNDISIKHMSDLISD